MHPFKNIVQTVQNCIANFDLYSGLKLVFSNEVDFFNRYLSHFSFDILSNYDFSVDFDFMAISSRYSVIFRFFDFFYRETQSRSLKFKSCSSSHFSSFNFCPLQISGAAIAL